MQFIPYTCNFFGDSTELLLPSEKTLLKYERIWQRNPGLSVEIKIPHIKKHPAPYNFQTNDFFAYYYTPNRKTGMLASIRRGHLFYVKPRVVGSRQSLHDIKDWLSTGLSNLPDSPLHQKVQEHQNLRLEPEILQAFYLRWMREFPQINFKIRTYYTDELSNLPSDCNWGNFTFQVEVLTNSFLIYQQKLREELSHLQNVVYYSQVHYTNWVGHSRSKEARDFWELLKQDPSLRYDIFLNTGKRVLSIENGNIFLETTEVPRFYYNPCLEIPL